MKMVKWRRAQNQAIMNRAKRRMADPAKCHIVVLGDCGERKTVTRGAVGVVFYALCKLQRRQTRTRGRGTPVRVAH